YRAVSVPLFPYTTLFRCGSLLKGMIYGAGLMYFFDPDRGRRRRAGVVDRTGHLLREVEDLWEKGCRDLANRSVGMAAESKRILTDRKSTRLNSSHVKISY